MKTDFASFATRLISGHLKGIFSYKITQYYRLYVYFNLSVYISRDFSLALAIEMHGRPFLFRPIPTYSTLWYIYIYIYIFIFLCLSMCCIQLRKLRHSGQLMGVARNRTHTQAPEKKLLVALLANVETGTNCWLFYLKYIL